MTEIRLRACLAVVENSKILLVSHYNTDLGPITWTVPGGAVEFGESVKDAALREFQEETGYEAMIEGFLDLYEVLKPAQPYQSVTIAFRGHIVGGAAQPEDTPWGLRSIRWFSLSELTDQPHHPPAIVTKALQ